VPLLSSFYPKAPFYKKWKPLAISTLVTAAFFIVWDILFTHIGVWGFNPDYITGTYVFGLPIEEILFFFCIPYACIFTYHILDYLIEEDYLFPHQEIISGVLIVILFIGGLFNIHRLYTSVTFILLAFLLTFITLKIRPRYMGRFYFTFLVILIPFLLVNGILTGSFIESEVVWYNNAENLGIRIGTIPFEDIFYGMFMIVMNIAIFERFMTTKK
jgi:lycopene cyclase domain-containing protein